jgi:hypothetical protein
MRALEGPRALQSSSRQACAPHRSSQRPERVPRDACVAPVVQILRVIQVIQVIQVVRGVPVSSPGGPRPAAAGDEDGDTDPDGPAPGPWAGAGTPLQRRGSPRGAAQRTPWVPRKAKAAMRPRRQRQHAESENLRSTTTSEAPRAAAPAAVPKRSTRSNQSQEISHKKSVERNQSKPIDSGRSLAEAEASVRQSRPAASGCRRAGSPHARHPPRRESSRTCHCSNPDRSRRSHRSAA